MNTPTPGRVVHFFPSVNDGIARNGDAPLAALIVAVLGDRLVNLTVFDAHGNTHPRTDVHLIQDDTDVYVTDDARAEWPVQRAIQAVAATVVDAPAAAPVTADEKVEVAAPVADIERARGYSLIQDDAPFNVADAFKDAGLVELTSTSAPVETNETAETDVPPAEEPQP